MSLNIFLAVIAAAIFQASWNFFAKKSKADKVAVLTIGWLLLGLSIAVTLPWSVDFSQFNNEWLTYSLASGAIHALYIALLGWGYAVGEISVVYPIARGLGILWTTLLSVAMGLNTLSANGAIGIAAIIGGVILIGQKAIQTSGQKKAFLIAVAISITISAYSLIDSLGAKVVPLAFYIMMMNAIAALLVLPFLLRFSREKVLSIIRLHKRESFLIAVGGSLSYVIILWAFRGSPVAYIAALREVSVVVASILGLVFLGETFSKRKILGIALVTMGAIFLKWS